MPTVVRLFLVAHSRDESGAGSRDFVRLFADGIEIASFGRPPGAGRAYTLEADSNIELDALRGSRLALGMSGADAWAPRAAFLYGQIDTREPKYVPLAHALAPGFFEAGGGRVSQDLDEGKDRWPLNSLGAARSEDQLNTFVVITHAHPFTVEGAGSDGPLHFSLYAALSNVPVLVVSTPLPRMGDVPPGAQNQTYLNTIRIWDFDPLAAHPLQLGVAASGLVAVQFRNLSEDAWKPDELIVFGLDERRGIATLLAVSSRPHWWAGQEPSDAAKAGFGFGAGDSLMLPILH